MDSRQGKALLRRLARGVAFVAVMVVGAMVVAGPAAAETATPSPAAQIAHAEFLPYMDPPPGEPATVCLVDTGVDINPDTESTVVEREALDGGDPGDVWDRKHGTEMAMAMGAPINDWGTVGAWPLVRIVSVRAMAQGATSFPFSYYAKAIQICLKLPAVRVINLSFSGPRPSDSDIAHVHSYATQARANGISVVAGSGNSGGEIEWPAADPAVFAVGAADGNGEFCPFSGRGGGLAIRAPGCGLELADPATGEPVSYAGTSPAAAFTSAVIAALRSYRPDLTAAGAEAVLRDSASSGSLDVNAAFRKAGLEAAVNVAENRAVATAAADTVAPSPWTDAAATPWPETAPPEPRLVLRRWPTPRLKLKRCRRGVVEIHLSKRPAQAKVVIRQYEQRAEFGGTLLGSFATHRLAVTIKRRFDFLTVAFEGARREPSRLLRVQPCGSSRR